MEILVCGAGMAGARLVQELVGRGAGHRVTLVGDEAGTPYNRMQLSNVLAGTTRADALELLGVEWLAAHGVRHLPGREVIAVDRAARTARLDDGRTLGWDRLVLATGSEPVLPPVTGLVTDAGLVRGAVLFRTADDCARIAALADDAQRAVVLGGGVLGVEAARALAGRGVPVVLVQRGERLMERQLDAAAARTLRRSLDDLGVTVLLGTGVAAVDGSGGRLRGVELDDGTRRPADLLVLSCGVRPRTGLARAAGLAVGRGVLVDDSLRSVTDPDVHAIGECAEHRGTVHGLVAPAWEQAAVAAAALSGTPAVYAGSAPVTRLKAAGLELAALGDPHDTGGAGEEVVRFSDSGRGVYQKLVLRDGRLVGAILLGDTRTVGTVLQVFDGTSPLPLDRAGLLMVRRNSPATTVRTPTSLPAQATICHCNGVTKAAITRAWEAGARSVEEIADRTRATTGCGTCREVVCGVADWLAQSDPEPAIA